MRTDIKRIPTTSNMGMSRVQLAGMTGNWPTGSVNFLFRGQPGILILWAAFGTTWNTLGRGAQFEIKHPFHGGKHENTIRQSPDKKSLLVPTVGDAI